MVLAGHVLLFSVKLKSYFKVKRCTQPISGRTRTQAQAVFLLYPVIYYI